MTLQFSISPLESRPRGPNLDDSTGFQLDLIAGHYVGQHYGLTHLCSPPAIARSKTF
jgi:hypothetical protein